MWKPVVSIVASAWPLFLLSPAHSEITGVEKLEAARTQFRVCAAPDNLPFTNRQGEGFDDRIAQLLAQSEGKPLVYTWWGAPRGLVSNTLNRWDCDVVMGVPTGYELTATTRPYYCSTYVEVQRPDEPALTLSDPPTSAKRIGVVVRTPPLDILLRHHLDPQVYLPTGSEDQDHPGRIVDDVAAGRIDAAFVWGPIAGYFARHEPKPLAISAIAAPADHDIHLSFPVSIGVRRGDNARLARLDQLIEEHQSQITDILRSYGVPFVDNPVRCPPHQHAAERSAAGAPQHPVVDRLATGQEPKIELIAEQSGEPAQGSDAHAHITCKGPVTLPEVAKIADPAPSGSAPPYKVAGNKVDPRTYEGWIRFSAFCQVCHGVGGVGSAIAPDLDQAIKDLNQKQFETIVTCGLTGNLGTGVMPSWGDNPNIKPYIDDLWAYLKARGDGALGPGRPEKM